MKKRLFAVLLCAALLCTLLPQTALHAGAETVTSGTCGDSLVWSYDEDTKTLTVSGTGMMDDFYYDGWLFSIPSAPWNSYLKRIEAVVIEEGVESIGDYAFFMCSNLERVTVADSVRRVGLYAFRETVFYDAPENRSDGVLYAGSCLIAADRQVTGRCEIREGTTVIADEAFGTYFEYDDEDGYLYYPGACKQLTGVVIPDSVTHIGRWAFSCCTALTEISVGSGVREIDRGAFYSCSSLSRVNIADPAAWAEIGFLIREDAPSYYAGNLYVNGAPLTRLELPEGTKRIGAYAFYGCRDLTEITVPDSVTEIGTCAFRECGYETYGDCTDGVLYLGRFLIFAEKDISGVRTVRSGTICICGEAFKNCTGLTGITLPSGLTSIAPSAFFGSGLTSVSIPGSVKEIGNEAFSNCHSLTALSAGEGLEKIGDQAFFACTVLESVTLPDSVSRIGRQAFLSTDFLNNAARTNGILYAGSCLIKADASLSGVCRVKAGTKTIADEAFSTGGTGKVINVTSLILPDGLRTIGKNAFESLRNLASVEIPDSVTDILTRAFYTCKNLTDAHYLGSKAQWQTIRVEEGNGPLLGALRFEGGESNVITGTCGADLRWSLDTETHVLTVSGTGPMSGWDSADKVPWHQYRSAILSAVLENGAETVGSRAFYGCSGLTEIKMPGSVTSIGNYAFSGCTALKSVSVPENLKTVGICAFAGSGTAEIALPDTVTAIGEGAFRECANLKSITIPEGVKHIPQELFYKCTALRSAGLGAAVTIGKKAFSGCSSLTEAVIPGTVTEIRSAAFENCISLKRAVLPDSVTLVEYDAFSGCTGIKEAVLPANMTALQQGVFSGCASLCAISFPEGLESIGWSSFFGCVSLTAVEMPRSVKIVWNRAFSGCNALKDVNYAGTEEDWNAIEIREGNEPLLAAALHAHVHSFTDAVTPPTCTEPGFTVRTCGCGYSCTDFYTDALGHDYVNHEAKPATCTEPGWEAYQTCGRCDYTTFAELAKLGHSYENGVCTRCGEKDPEYAPPADPCADYPDILPGSWYYGAAAFVIEKGLMGSTSGTELKFEPMTKVTRAMVASILYRIAETPDAEYSGAFRDVPAGVWYSDAVEWCAQNGLANGKGDGRFDPNGSVTRQELAVFMMKTADYLGRDTSGRADLDGFADAASVPAWSREALAWAAETGIVSGQAMDGKTFLNPAAGAMRCELASVLERFLQSGVSAA